ncbi:MULTISPECIES: diaminopimelate epimerase [unclassified Lactobacillus]|uniref:diaminopimelate epimerase n=1 Tax=unclassified Lactobacillus TaxID=2620435 RepID=UPI00226A2C78|nr:MULTISPECIES: diaminopimelate epimerase [unclassified Lactobacillus]MCX8722013.1 diaminopimelate epimerase [Lactobacillus sp. B4010]MCX8732651.1 diaminopimelate epimerase [Lactobacillus sp. B4015]MCX8734871.1 diaminopimelate epimerase [Lactobacillus sp. B4012]
MVYMQKVHGSQNTFFLLDQTQLKQTLSQAELVRLAKQLTNSKTGLLGGADGLLVVSSSSHQNVLGKMQVINADGSIASMCGNGLRTVGRYLAEKYHQNSFKVETQQADLKVSVEPDWAENVKAISVEISPVSFAKQDLSFDQLNCNQLINQEVPAFAPGLKFTAVAVPNPHLISIVSAEVLASSLLEKLGTKLNQPNPYFPDGVNVSFAQVIDSRHLFVRTFERGVGFTNACGTGMSAASLVFALTHQQEKVFNHLLTVSNPGGFVQTRVHQQEDHYWIELIGNATVTHNINADESLFHQDLPDFSLFQVEQTSENAAYQAFISNNK